MDHGLNTEALAVLAACVVLWGAVSDRLVRWNVSAPTVFVVLGVATAYGPIHLVDVRLHSSTILTVAELTLAIVLFADAARVNVRAVSKEVGVSARLLALGLPLTIGAGTAVAFGLFNGTDIWVAAAIGAIVAPTDAALGAPIVQDQRLPSSVRRTLTIESGLNDGIATPFVNLFLAGALSAEALASQSVGRAAIDPSRGRRHRVVDRDRRRRPALCRRAGRLERRRGPLAVRSGSRHPGVRHFAAGRDQRLRGSVRSRHGVRERDAGRGKASLVRRGCPEASSRW